MGDRLLDAVDRGDLSSAACVARELGHAARRVGGETLALAAEMLEHHAAQNEDGLVRGSLVGVLAELQDVLEQASSRAKAGRGAGTSAASGQVVDSV
jgi:hypothetical protein